MKRKENIFGVVPGQVNNTLTESVTTLAEGTSQTESQENGPVFFLDSCLVDHSGRQYACIHKHCQEKNGCFRHNLLLEQFNFHELHFHPDDRQLWREQVFPDIKKFIDSEQAAPFPDFRFIFNHRYIRRDGNTSQFMHEGAVSFSGDRRLPVLTLKVFYELADIKTDETIILTIFKYSDDQGYQKVFTKEYRRNAQSILSPRELEVIRLCYDGLSSKMIAGKLGISIHTVKNHKRNSMEKTLTHNISELIHVCIQNRWL